MRTEKEIVERIKALLKQIDQFEDDIERLEGLHNWSNRETYRAWIRQNLMKIDELKWVIDNTIS